VIDNAPGVQLDEADLSPRGVDSTGKAASVWRSQFLGDATVPIAINHLSSLDRAASRHSRELRGPPIHEGLELRFQWRAPELCLRKQAA